MSRSRRPLRARLKAPALATEGDFLPLAARALNGPPPSSPGQRIPLTCAEALLNRKVLIVDDGPEVREGLGRLMRDDYDVALAGSADEALRLLADEGPFAVIVSDFEMPGEDGICLLERARAECPSTVRILMTGHADLEVSQAATNRSEVFRFLEKPLPGEVLRATVEEGVRRYEETVCEDELLNKLARARGSVESLIVELDSHPVDELSDLASSVSAGSPLQEIARSALDHGARCLPGRGLRLELYTGRRREDAVSASAGPRLRGPIHREMVGTVDGEVGHLVIGGLAGRDLSVEERALVRALASITGVATHNQIRRRQRDDAQHAVIFAMARLAETRDNETGQHLERVSSYCALVAETLRGGGEYTELIDDAFVEDLIRSAPLHDVGKVGIPDAILLKPGKLDEEEWAVMSRHPQIGADLLRRVIERTDDPGFLLMALDIAWCHHEKWDGTGYPRGLAGKDIPLAARILSIADCFDALTTKRPYKDPWKHEEAIAYLREMSGSQFDPKVVEAFLSQERQADEIRIRLADRDA